MRPIPPSREAFPFRTTHDLRFVDMDMLGHANNGAFSSLMESNRAAFVRNEALGLPLDIGFVLARFEIDYLSEMHWPGRVEAGTGVLAMGNTSLRLQHGLFVGERCVAVGLVICVTVDLPTRKPVPLSAACRDALTTYMMR